MSPLRRRARRLGMASGALTLTLAAGCAPHLVRPPELTLAERRLRFEHALEERLASARALEAPMSLWTSLGGRRLPGVSATAWLGAPDSVRVVVNGLFGTAVEAAALADSITVWLPSRRAAFRADAARDSLGIERPGAWLADAVAARWRPPPEAWEAASGRDSLLVVAWSGPDREARELVVGSGGLPREFSASLGDGRRVVVDYREWRATQGPAWPMTFEIHGEPPSWRVVARLERVRFLPAEGCGCLAVRVPENAKLWSWQRLRAALAGAALVGG